LRDFCICRQARESAASNLIPEQDYPKIGLGVGGDLSYQSACESRRD
jgi:hypothetical protein